MKKSLIAMAVLGAASGFAMAASNVTLYGIIETGALVQKGKHADTTIQMKSGFDQGSRWGIKGTEELGNGYSVGFILEQGFSSDDGAEANGWKDKDGKAVDGVFNRESILSVKGGFGSLAFGRTGALGSGAQSQHILTGWALGTGYGLSAWNAQTVGTLRANNAISYASPAFAGFTVHAMYSNGTTIDTNKWSENGHYYGLGVKYQEAAIKSSLIFEALDNKNLSGDEKKAQYRINYGLEYNLGSWTPMFAYQWVDQDNGLKTHKFGLSSKISVGGGDALIGAAYLFGKDDGEKVRNWNVGAAYVYPLSKRTALKAYAGYADSSKAWKEVPNDPVYNGYQVFLGMRHQF